MMNQNTEKNRNIESIAMISLVVLTILVFGSVILLQIKKGEDCNEYFTFKNWSYSGRIIKKYRYQRGYYMTLQSSDGKKLELFDENEVVVGDTVLKRSGELSMIVVNKDSSFYIKLHEYSEECETRKRLHEEELKRKNLKLYEPFK